MEMRLFEAAYEGNVELLRQLRRENLLVIDRVTSGYADESALHVASLLGHVEFVKEILQLNPELAEVLDSHKSSPLHLASAKGYVEIAIALISARPGMCTVLDRDGFNPLHLAAIKGKVDVLRELVRAMPQAARARVDHGGTILHLCVKFCQMEALNLLLETMDDGLKNATDNYGNTILHLAVADKQIKVVKYLLTNGIDVNAKNAMGNTALDILAQSHRGVQDYDISNCLKDAIDLKAVERDQAIPFSPTKSNPQMPWHVNAKNAMGNTALDILAQSRRGVQDAIDLKAVEHDQAIPFSPTRSNPQMPWLVKKRNILMVVASVLAGMAFQVGISPPGGVWKEDSIIDIPNPYRAGEAVVAYNYQETYEFYVVANTIGFFASLSAILLVISGLPLKRRSYMWILMVVMWLSITLTAFTYAFSIVAVTKIQDRGQLRLKMHIAVSVWCGLPALLLFRNAIRLIVNRVREKQNGNKDIKRSFKFASGRPSRREPIAPPNLVNTSQADVCFSCSRCEFH